MGGLKKPIQKSEYMHLSKHRYTSGCSLMIISVISKLVSKSENSQQSDKSTAQFNKLTVV